MRGLALLLLVATLGMRSCCSGSSWGFVLLLLLELLLLAGGLGLLLEVLLLTGLGLLLAGSTTSRLDLCKGRVRGTD